MHLLGHPRRLGAIGDTLAKDGNHHLVGRTRAENFVGLTKQGLVRLGTREENHVLAKEPEATDPTALLIGPLKQANGIFDERNGVTDQPPFNLGGLLSLPVVRGVAALCAGAVTLCS